MKSIFIEMYSLHICNRLRWIHVTPIYYYQPQFDIFLQRTIGAACAKHIKAGGRFFDMTLLRIIEKPFSKFSGEKSGLKLQSDYQFVFLLSPFTQVDV